MENSQIEDTGYDESLEVCDACQCAPCKCKEVEEMYDEYGKYEDYLADREFTEFKKEYDRAKI